MNCRQMASMLLVFCLACAGGLSAYGQDSLHVRRVGSLSLPGTVSHIKISGDYAYVACMGGGLRIVNISNPAAPVLTGSFQPGIVWDVAIRDTLAFTACDQSGIRIVNVAHPATPSQIGFYLDASIAVQRYVAVRDTFVYIGESDTTWSARLRAVNVVDPAHPVEAGYMTTNGRDIMHTAFVGEYAITTEGIGGADLVRLHLPGSPVRQVNWGDTCTDVSVSGDYLFLARQGSEATTGLLICSAGAVPNRTSLGFCPLTGSMRGVAASGTHAFVAAGNRGLYVVDYSDAASPFESGFYDTPGVAEAVAVSGNYAFVADGSTLGVYDCTEAMSAGFRILGPVPREIGLTAYPNPFNPSTAIDFEVPETGWVTLAIRDLEGREVAVLVSQRMPQGAYSAVWNAEAYASGTYFAVMSSITGRTTQRLVLIR
jgi:hypothetical protein